MPPTPPRAGERIWIVIYERGYVEHVGPGWWRRSNGPVLHTEVPAVLVQEELCPA